MATPQNRVELGVVVAPGVARDMTERIAEELEDDLRKAYEEVGCEEAV